ncbi:MAG: hypothetical protein HIU81_04265 [Acidobacteria bacterium]|nr:hypothetical protein [Acidobacteriota bacterium]
MPSFRATLKILGLRPGNPPEAVMTTAEQTLASIHVVEAKQLDIVGGVPQITLRFTVDASTYQDENDAAANAAANMRHSVDAIASTGTLHVLRRAKGKWLPVN